MSGIFPQYSIIFPIRPKMTIWFALNFFWRFRLDIFLVFEVIIQKILWRECCPEYYQLPYHEISTGPGEDGRWGLVGAI